MPAGKAKNVSRRDSFAGLFMVWCAGNLNSYLWMFSVALVLRLGLIFIGHTYRFKTIEDHFDFGWEMGRIGRALASGQGFANPFNGITGPTAWQPPLYPFLIAGVFRVFGIYSKASAIVLLTINSIFAAFTCIPIYLIAKKCFGEKIACWSAWMWAILPFVMVWATRWVWETSVSTCLLAVIFWLTLRAEDREGIWPWAQFGFLWGSAALLNTSLLSFLPASGLWIWHRRWKKGKRSLGGVVLAAALFFACITPWLVRDYHVFGRFIFIRSNFGVELAIGNGPGADGTWREYLHPTQNVYEMRRYQQLGELAYAEACKKKAWQWIRADYGRFAWISFKRFVYYWAGIPKTASIAALAPWQNSAFLASSVLALWGLGRALRQRKPDAWLFFWLIFLYPAIYYFVFPHPRYRHPIEPELLILIVYIISEATTSKPRES